jgi:hypothetical protein
MNFLLIFLVEDIPPFKFKLTLLLSSKLFCDFTVVNFIGEVCFVILIPFVD